MKKILLMCFVVLAFASCATSKHQYGDAGAVVNFDKSDFEMSAKKSASATVTRILGIDFAHLFSRKQGYVQGTVISPTINPLADKSAARAAHKLMVENPDYDVMFYPTVETEKVSYIIMSTTKAKVSAKLGRMK